MKLQCVSVHVIVKVKVSIRRLNDFMNYDDLEDNVDAVANDGQSGLLSGCYVASIPRRPFQF